MTKSAVLVNKVRQALNIIPKEYCRELREDIINTNISRLTSLSVLLIIMNIVMIIVDTTLFYPKWSFNRGYVNLYYAHALIILERILYLAGIYLIYLRKISLSNRHKSLLILYSCAITLAWCSYLSINAQLIHGQISAFIIGSFSVATSILLLPAHSIGLLTVNSTIFIIALYSRIRGGSDFASNLLNAMFVLSFSFLMSYINITLFIKNQINKKTIHKQAKQLEESKNELEETVRTRTEELVNANRQLITEMGIRHEIELQAMRTRLLYEENTKLLMQIKEYEELRNVFFANLSHELRTPLNVIFSAQQMQSFIMHNQACDNCKSKMDRYNGIIRQNCYRLIRLIGNLIDITKIDADYFEISKKNCDIVKLIRSITQSVSTYMKDKNIELHFDSSMEEKLIACDPDKIERIMLNLLSNAVKFTPEKGHIHVNVSSAQGYAVISVADTGIGISEKMQEVIFERFVQADKSLTRNREGSGIGLSLVKALVDLHQGKITLTSEPGKGSRFLVELPDELMPHEECAACSCDSDEQNIERIHIEFSDIYS